MYLLGIFIGESLDLLLKSMYLLGIFIDESLEVMSSRSEDREKTCNKNSNY